MLYLTTTWPVTQHPHAHSQAAIGCIQSASFKISKLPNTVEMLFVLVHSLKNCILSPEVLFQFCSCLLLAATVDQRHMSYKHISGNNQNTVSGLTVIPYKRIFGLQAREGATRCHHWWTEAFGKLMKRPWTSVYIYTESFPTTLSDRLITQTSDKSCRSRSNQVDNLDFGREKPRPHRLWHPPNRNNKVTWVEI